MENETEIPEPKHYYSASTGGFYDTAFNSQVPLDAVEITLDQKNDLLEGQANGKLIVAGANGFPALADRPAPSSAELWQDVRARRNQLLALTDWTQLPDVPAGTAARYVAYRQALRDLPESSPDPTQVTWPVSP